jgi:hypothetical protein
MRTTPDTSLTGIPRIGRATAIGALIGASVVAIPVTIALIALGGGGYSLIAGVHVGFFGGMGYGGMLAAVIRSDRWERATEGRTDRESVDVRAPDATPRFVLERVSCA